MAEQQQMQLSHDAYATFSSSSQELRGVRILLLVDEISAITDGGTERQILQIVDICNQIGMSPHLCFLRRTRWLDTKRAGCPTTHFQIEKVASWNGIRSLAQLTRWMRAQRFDMLQTFFPESNLLGPVAGRLAGIPVILGTRRNLNHFRPEDPHHLQLRLQRWVNPLVDQIVANSQAVRERTVASENTSQSRVKVIYNGIDLAHMCPAPELRAAMRAALGIAEDQILVGNISGLRKIKGVDMFVHAAAEAYPGNANLRFVIVGDGELKPQLEELIQSYRMQNVIRLVGAAEDVRPYLAAFDVAVLCSQAEGFSNSLLEYMACGVPAIATDVGGNREALESCGLLIGPETGELVRAIHAMADPLKRETFSRAALLKVQQFDVKCARARTEELYSMHLAKRNRQQHPAKSMLLTKVQRVPSEDTP